MTLSVGMLPKLTPLQFLTQKVGNRGGGGGEKRPPKWIGSNSDFHCFTASFWQLLSVYDCLWGHLRDPAEEEEEERNFSSLWHVESWEHGCENSCTPVLSLSLPTHASLHLGDPCSDRCFTWKGRKWVARLLLHFLAMPGGGLSTKHMPRGAPSLAGGRAPFCLQWRRLLHRIIWLWQALSVSSAEIAWLKVSEPPSPMQVPRDPGGS